MQESPRRSARPYTTRPYTTRPYVARACAAALAAVLLGGLPAAPAGAGTAPPAAPAGPAAPPVAPPVAPVAPPVAASMDAAVVREIVSRTGRTAADLAAAGRDPQVKVSRRAPGWAFGSAVLTAPRRPGAYPDGWLFVAHREAGGWTAALDRTARFDDLAGRAPAAIVRAGERSLLGGRLTTAGAGNDTGLSLPYATGQTWTLTGGPHGWGGAERPFSAVDLSGGDQRVRAAGGGRIYTMCGNSLGWLRIYHPSGYATDYYHLWNNIQPPDGSTVAAGAALGDTGTDVSCGGSASGRHVHWAILAGETRVPWHWRSAGKWVFWEGSAPYGGYAMHGSTRVDVGGGLVNHGALGPMDAIVDANGGGVVNKRGGPGTGSPVVGSVGDGATVTIQCWANGTTHTGRYGTTAVWDRLTDGTWISDAFVYTGVDRLGPQC